MTRARTNADQAHTESFQHAHIIPGVLYPAVSGKLLDGSTSHSGNYGTAQSDGRSYYYTDIKGSKPIKDPRIGAHFGSQRHKFKSMQLLEQETATHGSDISSFDGREWCRAIGTLTMDNNDHGQGRIRLQAAGQAFEVTGYFNGFNLLYANANTARNLKITIDNVVAHSSVNYNGSTDHPLGGRYVDAHAVVNVDLTSSSSLSSDTTLGIHTIKIEWVTGTDTTSYIFGFELIAQDTSSTANKSKIQIPSQNVVSYGKKFTVSGTPHYDPFNGFTNDTTLFSSVVDVATSLGLGTATTWGAPWDKGSDDHIRPFNGGRVVKWVDSSGTIKTSVTMMPANAQNIGNNNASGSAGVASNEITTASATNTHTINFSDDVIDDSLAEVAKTYNYREFGNGSANGNTSYADASTLSGNDDIAYVMDDGLSSLSASGVNVDTNEPYVTIDASEFIFFTFIGTGFSISSTDWTGAEATELPITVVQNLPYGTHVVKVNRASDSTMTVIVDGVTVSTDTSSTRRYYRIREVTIHQPKKPPIPEEAVVLADYMLYADWVAIGDAETGMISKGARRINGSRDIFYNRDSGSNSPTLTMGTANVNSGANFGFRLTAGSASPLSCDLPVFSNKFAVYSEDPSAGSQAMSFGGTASTISKLDNSVNDDLDAFVGPSSATDLGLNKLEYTLAGGYVFAGFDVHGVTHTSSHYQTFETPFLHELVGGDRNMEQNNLVVTPDGKTWDEVTRDTSYIGKKVLHAGYYLGNGSVNPLIIDEWRGLSDYKNRFNKDWAIAYDRLICLVDGQYKIAFHAYSHTTGMYFYCNKNAVTTSGNNYDMLMYALMTAQDTTIDTNVTEYFVRGDWIQFGASAGNLDGDGRTWFEIERI